MLLFLQLPFGPVIDAVVGVAAFVVIGGIGERYFRKHATPEEIRADLEARKDDLSPRPNEKAGHCPALSFINPAGA